MNISIYIVAILVSISLSHVVHDLWQVQQCKFLARYSNSNEWSILCCSACDIYSRCPNRAFGFLRHHGCENTLLVLRILAYLHKQCLVILPSQSACRCMSLYLNPRRSIAPLVDADKLLMAQHRQPDVVFRVETPAIDLEHLASGFLLGEPWQRRRRPELLPI